MNLVYKDDKQTINLKHAKGDAEMMVSFVIPGKRGFPAVFISANPLYFSNEKKARAFINTFTKWGPKMSTDVEYVLDDGAINRVSLANQQYEEMSRISHEYKEITTRLSDKVDNLKKENSQLKEKYQYLLLHGHEYVDDESFEDEMSSGKVQWEACNDEHELMLMAINAKRAGYNTTYNRIMDKIHDIWEDRNWEDPKLLKGKRSGKV